MMLDRTRMSAKNKWTDGQSRVYIFYPLKEIMQDLGVCNTTVTKMLKLDNKYVVFGESGMEFTSDKTGSEEHYYLTIASLVKELDYRGFTNVLVILAVGLPLTWCGGDEKAKFREYIMRKPVIDGLPLMK